ncbi:hypothetical protein NCCP2331_15700 [Sporosarcina sp. NCCP-2331]|nr:hypothetical protein NCCP2331_15700 [Sporosarcina sp. NCCP-2331]GLB55541.1 hypothetical protein NCCP2378_13280 [Sporosarcina sp. NCCP-2378]
MNAYVCIFVMMMKEQSWLVSALKGKLLVKKHRGGYGNGCINRRSRHSRRS